MQAHEWRSSGLIAQPYAGLAGVAFSSVCLRGAEMHENQVLECIFFKKQQLLE
jgi:hypothetical protein